MKHNFLRLSAVLTAALLSAFLCTAAFGAARTADSSLPSLSNSRYVNTETGYFVIIEDDLDLLTDAEEQKLTEDMAAITAYGNVGFWTTDVHNSNYIDQTRLKRKELFQFTSATVFMINMNTRKMAIQSYGDIEKSVNDSKARSITDNCSSYATKKRYYDCASNVFSQIFRTIRNKMSSSGSSQEDKGSGFVFEEPIPEPMKYISFGVIALMIGLITAVGIAFAAVNNSLRQTGDPAAKIHKEGQIFDEFKVKTHSKKEYHRPKSSYGSHSSGSSCSSCSSCSSGSSCSSCSSGSSCGGCGSGGGSSF